MSRHDRVVSEDRLSICSRVTDHVGGWLCSRFERIAGRDRTVFLVYPDAELTGAEVLARFDAERPRLGEPARQEPARAHL